MWQRLLMSPWHPVSFFPFKNRSMQVLVEPIVTYIENPFPRFLHTGHGPWDLNESILCTELKKVKLINAG